MCVRPSSQFLRAPQHLRCCAMPGLSVTRFEGSSCTSRFGAQVCPAASCFASRVYCDVSFRCAHNARQGPLGLRCPAPHARAQWYVLSVWRGSSSHHTLLILTFVSYAAQGSLRAPTGRAAHAAIGVGTAALCQDQAATPSRRRASTPPQTEIAPHPPAQSLLPPVLPRLRPRPLRRPPRRQLPFLLPANEC